MRRLALTKDGDLTYCTASEENIGKGRCNHIAHQRDNEDINDFLVRISYKIKSIQMSNNEIENLDKLPLPDEIQKDVDILKDLISENESLFKLRGGYSILLNAINTKSDIECRPTVDMDLDLYLGSRNFEEECNKIILKMQNKGYIVKSKITQNNQLKLKIESKNGRKIDFDINPENSKRIGGLVQNINDSLTEKINLKLNLHDRRFKDLVDSITLIEIGYPNGITKKQLLNMVDTQKAKEFLSQDNFEQTIYQINKFNPKKLNGKTMQEYTKSFFNMVNELVYGDLSDETLFKNGIWDVYSRD